MGRVVFIFKNVCLQVFNVTCDYIVTQNHVHRSLVMQEWFDLRDLGEKSRLQVELCAGCHCCLPKLSWISFCNLNPSWERGMMGGQGPANKAVNSLSFISEFHFSYYRYHFIPLNTPCNRNNLKKIDGGCLDSLVLVSGCCVVSLCW